MIKYIAFATLFVFSSCVIDATKINYNEVIKNINNEREKLSMYDTIDYTKCSNRILTTLSDSVFPKWYKTPWDFNGISNVPGQGEIACGYFITTTLKHVGFNLNRYKLAQQAASTMINELCSKDSTFWYYSQEKAFNAMKKKGNGLFAVGLDSHVGYALVKDSILHFVHADFINDEVVKEAEKESWTFNNSSVYVVGEITNNQPLIKKWVRGTKVY